MPPDIINPPAVEPVDLVYAKTFLRIDSADEDALITDMLLSARIRVEAYSHHALITRRLRQRFDGGSILSFSVMPVSELHSVTAVSKSGERLDMAPGHYSLNTRRTPPRLCLSGSKRFQDFISDFDHAEIEYSAGYGDAPADVPMPFKQAILLLTAQSYERREQAGSDLTPSVPMMVDALLMPYRWMRL